MKTLIQQAHEYLHSQKGKYPQIAAATGLEINWIYRFMSSRSMSEPGVTKINKILCYRDGTLSDVYPPETKQSA